MWARGLVASQVALSLLLLAGALLLLTTLRNLQTADFGFDRHGVLTSALTPPARDIRASAASRTFARCWNASGIRPAYAALRWPWVCR